MVFSVVVPGGPFSGTELVFDEAPLVITPPLVIPIFYTCQFTDNVTQTELNHLNVANPAQAWVFKRI